MELEDEKGPRDPLGPLVLERRFLSAPHKRQNLTRIARFKRFSILRRSGYQVLD